MERGALDDFVVGSRPSKDRIDACKPPLPEGVMFDSPDHVRAIDTIVYKGKTCFISGEAGAGKSELMKYMRTWLANLYGESTVHVCATYGTAAANVGIKGAQTFHSFIGAQLGKKRGHDGVERMMTADEAYQQLKPKKLKTIAEANVVFLDEISAMGEKYFDLAEKMCRKVRRNPDVFFGGIQFVFIGDLLQIPPIGDKMVIFGKTWTKNIRKENIVYLRSNYRQNGDEEYRLLLRELRDGEFKYKETTLSKSCLRTFFGLATPLAERPGYNPEDTVVNIVATRKEAQAINDMELGKLPGPEVRFVAEATGPDNIVAMWRDRLLCQERFSLRVGARVMVTVNVDVKNGIVNGTSGEVRSMGMDGAYVSIYVPRLGRTIDVVAYKWEEREYDGTVVATYTQMPLMLAYATTVEKSQGQTLDKACVDFARMFEFDVDARKIYTALSRTRRLADLEVKNIPRIDWNKMVQNKEVVKYNRAIQS
jgi:hypothetical protein